MVELRFEQCFRSAPTLVFAALTDHARMGAWVGGGVRVTVDRPGTPAPNGLGAVRRIRAPGFSVYEAVTGWDPPHEMRYRLIRGLPLVAHEGRLRFGPTDTFEGGTRLEYDIRFGLPFWLGGTPAARVLGLVVERVLRGGLARLARDLDGTGPSAAVPPTDR